MKSIRDYEERHLAGQQQMAQERHQLATKVGGLAGWLAGGLLWPWLSSWHRQEACSCLTCRITWLPVQRVRCMALAKQHGNTWGPVHVLRLVDTGGGARGVPLEKPLRLACRMLLQASAGQVAGSC